MATLTNMTPFSIPQLNTSPANIWNNSLSYKNLKAKSLVDLQTRLSLELTKNNLSTLLTTVKLLKSTLINKFPTFNDFMDKICDGKPKKMTEIRIDVIMQRKLLMDWIDTILNDIMPTRIMALNVYETADQNNTVLYSCWDGQHTAIVLYIIATYVYNITDLDKILVPTVIYKGSISDIRKNFTALNSSKGKQLLDDYDLYSGRFISARLDGSTDRLDVLSEQVQSICEKHDVFITHPKFRNQHDTGAISRLLEVNKYVWKKGRVDVFENTIKLHNKLFKTEPVKSWELFTLCMFFDICHSNMINVDAGYIQEMANVLSGRFNDWDNDFKQQVHDAYIDMWHQSYNSINYNHPRFNNNVDQFSDYLIRLFESSALFDNTKYKLPKIQNTDYLASSF